MTNSLAFYDTEIIVVVKKLVYRPGADKVAEKSGGLEASRIG